MKIILSILLLILYVCVDSYYTYGDGSKTAEQIAADNEELQKLYKICDTQRLIADMISDKNWSYGACLRNEGGSQ